MKIVFYDLDGVACTKRLKAASGDWKSLQLDPIVVGMMNRIDELVSETFFVCTSAWRDQYSAKEMLKLFCAQGFTGKFHPDWRTEPHQTGSRGDYVSNWHARNQGATHAVIIDDMAEGYRPGQNLVLTDPDNGFSYQNLLQVLDHLGWTGRLPRPEIPSKAALWAARPA